MLTVLTPAPHQRLATLESVQELLGLADSPTGEARLRSLIDTTSDHLAEVCERVFGRQEYRETFGGFGRPEFQLQQCPVELPLGTVTFKGDTFPDVILKDPKQGILYVDSYFQNTALRGGLEADPRAGTEREDYQLTYWAGYVLPDDLITWEASEPRKKGQFVKPSGVTGYLYEVTTPGTSGTVEPTWPTTAGETVGDGTVTVTARAATALPYGLQEACRQEVAARYLWGARDSAIDAFTIEGVTTKYRDPSQIGGGRFKGLDTEALLRPFSKAWL